MSLASVKQYLTSVKPIDSRAPERFKQYRLLSGDRIEASNPPARGAELRAKLAEAQRAHDAKVEDSAAIRDKQVKDEKEASAARVKEIERVSLQAQHKADDEFAAIEAALLAEYAAPLSDEQVALLMAKPGEVVRVRQPTVTSTDTAGAVPQGA